MKVYCIPGIAADRRIFKNISLPDGFEAVYIDWIKPEKEESLSTYARRLAEKINVTEEFIIIGISLGGIMASEISNSHQPSATIIIGSVPVASQLPPYYKLAKKLKIQRLIPGWFYKMASIVKNYFSSLSAENKKTAIQMIREADTAFIRWGVDAVLKWTNQQKPKSLVHIHGTRDEVFPFAFTSPTHVIPKGGHLLVISHAEEINRIIRESLNTIIGK